MMLAMIPVWSHGLFCFVFRSLIALSLILAMLLFKPAPLYILDEVDAALDISHTQNIGQMIKSHFKHSQVRKYCWLIEVSLEHLQVRKYCWLIEGWLEHS